MCSSCEVAMIKELQLYGRNVEIYLEGYISIIHVIGGQWSCRRTIYSETQVNWLLL